MGAEELGMNGDDISEISRGVGHSVYNIVLWWRMHYLKAERDGWNRVLLQQTVPLKGCAGRVCLLREMGSQRELSVALHGLLCA